MARLILSTCEDDVKYSCIHSIVDQAIEEGEPVQRYYGSGRMRSAGAWVLFSALNFWAHWRAERHLRRRRSKEHTMRPYYIIGLNM